MCLLATATSECLSYGFYFFDNDFWPIAGLCHEALMWREYDSIQTGQWVLQKRKKQS